MNRNIPNIMAHTEPLKISSHNNLDGKMNGKNFSKNCDTHRKSIKIKGYIPEHMEYATMGKKVAAARFSTVTAKHSRVSRSMSPDIH
jgi:hypothetical protein